MVCLSPRALVTYALIFYAIVRHYLSSLLRFFRSNPRPSYVYRALLLDDQNADFVDVTQWMISDDKRQILQNWEELVRETYPEWETWRLEVRYMYLQRKYRLVLRPGDTLEWPPSTEKILGPTGVLSACLIPKDGDPSGEVDITARVKKYCGPDFAFKYGVRIRDMFPFDDIETNAAHFAAVRMICISPETKNIKSFLCPFLSDDFLELQ
jgi:hypothetical protein